MSRVVREDTGRAASELLRRAQRWAIVVAVVGAIATAVGAVVNQSQFFQSYLAAYLLWSGIALGCLGLALIHRLTGGFWGDASRDVLLASAETLPLFALLFVPIVVGIPVLYAWARPTVGGGNQAAPVQYAYLNVPFFIGRAILFIGSWIVVELTLVRWVDDWLRTGEHRYHARLRRLGAGGLILVGFTVAFAIIDWVMSLEAPWTSTIFPAMVGVGDLLVGFSVVVLVVSRFGRSLLDDPRDLPRLLGDLSGLLLALVMAWAYLAFSQFLLIWVGNLNDEITWYLSRLSNGWQWVAIVVVATQFVIPFGALIFRSVRRNARVLTYLTIMLIVGRLIDVIWLVEPAFPSTGILSHWLDLAIAIAMGGVWLAVFADRLRRRVEAEYA